MSLPVPISSDLLAPGEWENLLALNSELAHAYATRQIFRTETEARVSVLNDLHFPTKASKYWQSVREQCVMLEQLALLSFEWRRNELKIKRLCMTSPESEEAAIDLDECLWKRTNMRSVAADRMREIRMWSMLKAEQGEGFDKDDVNAHQLVSYTTQFSLRAAHADPSGMSAGELDNLSGQLRTALARCAELGLMSEVKSHLPPEVQKQLPAEATVQ